jgi:hypothetical protein
VRFGETASVHLGEEWYIEGERVSDSFNARRAIRSDNGRLGYLKVLNDATPEDPWQEQFANEEIASRLAGRALKTGNAHLALAAAAELRHVDLADALSLVLLIRDGDPLRYERAAVRWLARYAAQDRAMRLAEARELVDLLDGAGRHDRVAVLRLERWLRARGYEDEADRVA